MARPCPEAAIPLLLAAYGIDAGYGLRSPLWIGFARAILGIQPFAAPVSPDDIRLSV